jgi:methylphosphotriester-DNA--protein-cysteine methyltransferase
MLLHKNLSTSQLHAFIRQQKLTLGGNQKLKIYGTLHCKSGKRMKTVNRVFFTDENDAISNGYRPCAHCLKEKYTHWKNAQ